MHRYFQILNLSPGASKDQIKKAYRKLAMRYHPDRNPGPDAQQKFLEITEAYEYLMGMRKQRKVFEKQQFSAEEKQRIYEILKKEAERRAKEKYRERVRQFRKRQEEEQGREFQRAIYILLALVVLGVGGWQGYRFYRGLMIQQDPVTAEAWVTGIGNKRMIYAFESGDSLYQDHRFVSSVGITMLAGNGMPLKTGDRFEVEFNRHKPQFHRINFHKVSLATMQRYFDLSTTRIKYIYYDEWKELSDSEKNIRARCLTLLVFNHDQFRGLSKLYFSDTSPLENLRSNSISWWWMKNSDDFKAIKTACQKDAESVLQ